MEDASVKLIKRFSSQSTETNDDKCHLAESNSDQANMNRRNYESSGSQVSFIKSFSSLEFYLKLQVVGPTQWICLEEKDFTGTFAFIRKNMCAHENWDFEDGLYAFTVEILAQNKQHKYYRS